MKHEPSATSVSFLSVLVLVLWASNRAFSFQHSKVQRQHALFSMSRGMSTSANDDHFPSKDDLRSKSRRNFFGFAGVVAVAMEAWSATPPPASARYVLDDETGDYVEVEDPDWQTAWKQRLDKASTMSKDEIFQAARGAGNVELRDGPESYASKKRRAVSGCRDATVRGKARAGSEKECTARVFAGEIDFLLDVL